MSAARLFASTALAALTLSSLSGCILLGSYTAYLDYHSPLTRALPAS